MKSIKNQLSLIAIFFVGTEIAAAQSTNTTLQIAEHKSFVFKAKTASVFNSDIVADQMPGENKADLADTKIPIKTNAVVDVKPNKASSSLPYFDEGKTEDNTTNPTNNINVVINETPVKASAQHFSYNLEQKQQGNVEVTIKPKDNNSIDRYVFNINPDKSARLIVSVGSKRITYIGEIIVN